MSDDGQHDHLIRMRPRGRSKAPQSGVDAAPPARTRLFVDVVDMRALTLTEPPGPRTEP